MFKAIHLLFYLTLLTLAANAQQVSVSGAVTDEVDGYAIPYANIIFNDLRKRSLRSPEKKIFFDWRGRSITAGELLHCIDVVAIELIQTGLKKGQRVLFLSRQSIESAIYFFAIIRAGGSVVLVDPEMGQENSHSRILASQAVWCQESVCQLMVLYFSIE